MPRYNQDNGTKASNYGKLQRITIAVMRKRNAKQNLQRNTKQLREPPSLSTSSHSRTLKHATGGTGTTAGYYRQQASLKLSQLLASSQLLPETAGGGALL